MTRVSHLSREILPTNRWSLTSCELDTSNKFTISLQNLMLTVRSMGLVHLLRRMSLVRFSYLKPHLDIGRNSRVISRRIFASYKSPLMRCMAPWEALGYSLKNHNISQTPRMRQARPLPTTSSVHFITPMDCLS